MKKSTKNLLMGAAVVGLGYYLYKKQQTAKLAAVAMTLHAADALVAPSAPAPPPPPGSASRMLSNGDDITSDDDLEIADEWVWSPSALVTRSSGGGHHGHHGGGHRHRHR